MRSFPMAAAALLLLAGCVSQAPSGEGPEGATPEGGLVAPVVDDGSKPMPTDLGHMPHLHDYWEGRERVTLFDGEIDPTSNADPFDALEPIFVDKEAKAGRMLWRLPDGKIVYEATGRLEVTATWEDPKVTSLAFEFQPAGSNEFTQPLPLPHGKLVGVPVTPQMTDMPHTKTSRWVFGFETGEQPGAMLGPFHVRIDIVRVADIMLFPGHPELFNGLPEKIVEDGDHEHAEVSYAKRAPQLATEGSFGEKTITPSGVVPMETKAMRIEIDILEATSTPGVVSEIRFFFHGADTTYYGHPTVLPIEGSVQQKRLIYQIPVTMDQTDSPYAKTSQWLFFVEPAAKLTGEDAEPTCGGCTDVSIRYHLKAIAYDHELEEYSLREGDA